MPPEFMQILSPSYRVASSGHPRLVSGSVNQLPHIHKTLTQKTTTHRQWPPPLSHFLFHQKQNIFLKKKNMIFVLFLFHHLQVAQLLTHSSLFPPFWLHFPRWFISLSLSLTHKNSSLLTSFKNPQQKKKKKTKNKKTRLFSIWSRLTQDHQLSSPRISFYRFSHLFSRQVFFFSLFVRVRSICSRTKSAFNFFS